MAQLQAGLFAGLPGEPARLGPTDVAGDLYVTKRGTVLGTMNVKGGILNLGSQTRSSSFITLYGGNYPFVPPQVIPSPYANIYFGAPNLDTMPSFELQRLKVRQAHTPDSAMITIVPSLVEQFENTISLNGIVEGYAFVSDTTVEGFNALRFNGPYRLQVLEEDLVIPFEEGCIYIIGSPIIQGYCKVEIPYAMAEARNGLPLLKFVSNSALRQRIEIYDGSVPRVHVGTVDVTGQQVVDVIFDDSTDTGLFAVFSPYSETGDIAPEIDPGPPPEDPPQLMRRRPARTKPKITTS
jgi:hypothetical protein